MKKSHYGNQSFDNSEKQKKIQKSKTWRQSINKKNGSLMDKQDGSGKTYTNPDNNIGKPTTLHDYIDKSNVPSKMNWKDVLIGNMMSSVANRNRSNLLKRFRQYDSDQIGRLHAKDVKHVLTELPVPLTSIETNQYINELDTLGDGYIDIDALKEKIHLNGDDNEERYLQAMEEKRKRAMILPTHCVEKRMLHSNFVEENRQHNLGSSELIKNPIVHQTKSKWNQPGNDDVQADLAEVKIRKRFKNNPTRMNKCMSTVDGDQDDKINFEEFENAMSNMNIDLENDELCAVLRRYDPQNIGAIEYKRLSEAICYKMKGYTKERENYVCTKIMEKLDNDVINLKKLFCNSNGANVTIDELRRGLYCANLQLSDAEFGTLINISNVQGGNVDYWDWIQNIALRRSKNEEEEINKTKKQFEGRNTNSRGNNIFDKGPVGQHVKGLHRDDRKERVIVGKLMHRIGSTDQKMLKSMFYGQEHLNAKKLFQNLQNIGLSFSKEDYNRIWTQLDKKQLGTVSLKDIFETCKLQEKTKNFVDHAANKKYSLEFEKSPIDSRFRLGDRGRKTFHQSIRHSSLTNFNPNPSSSCKAKQTPHGKWDSSRSSYHVSQPEKATHSPCSVPTIASKEASPQLRVETPTEKTSSFKVLHLKIAPPLPLQMV